jgi:hypothetical protein
MDKTMTRFLAILAALTCAASAQTYRTVTADTNNVIRTNFTINGSQLTGSFPAELLRTNGSALGLTNFPASLLRTNGDGSGLTNLPNASLTNATGVLPLLNGGTGATNSSGARTALELGTAATNASTAFQSANTNLTALASGDGSSLTNVTITDASSLTNFPAELLRTNGSAGALTDFPAQLLRTNGDGSGLTNVSVDLTTVLPSYTGNTGKVLAVASGETNVEWTAISNTVTDASTLTNFPAIILQTNSADASFPAFLLRTTGSAATLTSFPASLLTTNGNASGLTNFPTLNQNSTGTASNVTGVVAIANGGSGQTTAAAAIEALLPAYSGNANRVLSLDGSATAVVWTNNAGATANLTNVTGILALSNGGTGSDTAQGAQTNLTIISGRRVKIGQDSTNTSNAGITIGGATAISGVNSPAVVIGNEAFSSGSDSVVLGAYAKNTNASSGVSIGQSSRVLNLASGGIALGASAIVSASDAVQIGGGSNTTATTLQFRSAGTIDTNEWSRLAALSTYPTTNISVVGTNNTNTLVFSNGILTSVTSP